MAQRSFAAIGLVALFADVGWPKEEKKASEVVAGAARGRHFVAAMNRAAERLTASFAPAATVLFGNAP